MIHWCSGYRCTCFYNFAKLPSRPSSRTWCQWGWQWTIELGGTEQCTSVKLRTCMYRDHRVLPHTCTCACTCTCTCSCSCSCACDCIAQIFNGLIWYGDEILSDENLPLYSTSITEVYYCLHTVNSHTLTQQSLRLSSQLERGYNLAHYWQPTDLPDTY